LECSDKDTLNADQKKNLDQIKLSCSLNLAFVTLRNNEYEKTVVHCCNALDVDPDNAKALYRRGRAFLAQDKWAKSKDDLTKALAKVRSAPPL